jgi:hypothetical protein
MIGANANLSGAFIAYSLPRVFVSEFDSTLNYTDAEITVFKT